MTDPVSLIGVFQRISGAPVPSAVPTSWPLDSTVRSVVHVDAMLLSLKLSLIDDANGTPVVVNVASVLLRVPPLFVAVRR
jgi:hypothetical protein